MPSSLNHGSNSCPSPNGDIPEGRFCEREIRTRLRCFGFLQVPLRPTGPYCVLRLHLQLCGKWSSRALQWLLPGSLFQFGYFTGLLPWKMYSNIACASQESWAKDRSWLFIFLQSQNYFHCCKEPRGPPCTVFPNLINDQKLLEDEK